MHNISNENINRVDEISQEVDSWKIINNGLSYLVIVLRYFRQDGSVEYGGYYKPTSSDECGNATGDFYTTPDEALNDLIFRIASHVSISD